MSRRPNARRRRILRTMGGSLAFILLAIGLVWAQRDQEAPYVPGEAVEGITDSLGRRLPASHPELRFEEVAREAGIDFRHFQGQRSTQLPEDMGSGAAWGDYDGDGWQDLFVVNFAGPLTASATEREAGAASHRLYRNLGDGRFEDVSELAGLARRGFGMAAAWADFDADGDLDLAVSHFGPLELYRNEGGAFEEVAAELGITPPESFWAGLSWADYDRDGDLDLYVCGYVQYDGQPGAGGGTSMQYGAETPASLNPSSFAPERNLLYRNEGGRFSEVAEAAGVANAAGRSLSAVWSDFDEDGWPDLYVANDVSDNALFVNQGDGVFADQSLEAWVADYRGAMGLATGDWDGDRDLDLFVTHWIAQENALYENMVGPAGEDLSLPPGAEAAAARPAPRFNDRADAQGLGQIALDFIGWGTVFVDLDLDGREDLFVVNGSTLQDREEPRRLVPMADQVFWNAGADGFFDLGEAIGEVVTAPRVSRGAAAADYDQDGDVDLFVVDFDGPARLLRNAGGSEHHWLTVRLRGPAGNPQGIGARLSLRAGGRWQLREIGAGSSYLSQNAAEAYFGLGPASEVEALYLRWPDGSVQQLGPIPADQLVEVSHGEAWTALGGRALTDHGAPRAPAAQGEDASADGAMGREETLRFWETYRESVRIMKQASDWEAAAAGFEAALALDPGHEESRYNLGNCLVELGRYAEALAHYQIVIERNPQSLRGNLQIGHLRSSPMSGPEIFDLELARGAYARALALNPEESGSLILLGATELARGELEAAEGHLRQARQLNDQALLAHYLPAYIAWRSERREEALALLGEAVAIAAGPAPVEAVPGEGATASGRAMLVESLAQRRLFGPLLIELERWDAEAVIDESVAATEFARLEAYLDALPD